MPEEATRFAKAVVEAAAPASKSRARALLFAASRLGAFATSVGLELRAELVLHGSVIERFCAESDLSYATRRTLRSNLRYLAGVVFCDTAAPVPMSRDRAKIPYSPADIASYLALADAQPTALRRARASALVCLGAGAGLIGGELRRVRGTDVLWRSGGMVVLVAGHRARAVPVLSNYQHRLFCSAKFFAGSYLVSGRNPDSHNVTNPLLRSLSGGKDLARLEVARLRSTWLCQTADHIGLKAFMDAAGISCSQRLGDLVSRLPTEEEERAVALLGAARPK